MSFSRRDWLRIVASSGIGMGLTIYGIPGAAPVPAEPDDDPDSSTSVSSAGGMSAAAFCSFAKCHDAVRQSAAKCGEAASPSGPIRLIRWN